MKVIQAKISDYEIAPYALADGNAGVHPKLALEGRIDEEAAQELGGLGLRSALFGNDSKVTSAKVASKNDAVLIKLYPIANDDNAKLKSKPKPLHTIESAGVKGFSAKRSGREVILTFGIALTSKDASVMTSFMLSHPGWVGDVEIVAQQGELFPEEPPKQNQEPPE